MAAGYGTDLETVVVVDSDTVAQNFYLPAGWLDYTPAGLDVTLEMFQTDTRTWTLNNLGGLPVDYELVEVDKGMTPLGPIVEPANGMVKPWRVNFKTAQGIGVPRPLPEAPLLAAGDVIQSWAPSENSAPWGIAFGGDNVWVSEGWGSNEVFAYATDGTYTGVSYPYTWGPANGPADAAFNGNTGMLWVLDVGGDNCIHEVDPEAGVTGNTICPSFPTSERGLAYDPSTDTYFAGGWNDGAVYHFAPDGTLLDSANVNLPISGLAYNPDTMHLFVMVNASPNPVYVLDAANGYVVVGQFNVSAGFGDYSGAGLEFDCDGNLWAVDQGTATVYQLESGETGSFCNQDVPWLSESPITGTLTAGGSQDFTIGFDAGQVDAPGVYHAQLKIKENTPYVVANVPVTLTVTPPADLGLLEGTIETQGYCDENPAPLEGAVVTIEDTNGVTYTVVTDADGWYYRWLVEAGNPYIVTVSAVDQQDPATEVISITGQSTVTMDYSLRWLKPCVSADPTSYEVTLGLGYSTVETMDLVNGGAGGASYEYTERDMGYIPPAKAFLPASDGKFPRGTDAPSSGRAPIISGKGAPAQIALPNGTIAYSVDAASSFFTGFDLDVPEVLPNIAAFSSADFPGAGEYVGDYVYVLDIANNLYQVDPADGTVLSTMVVDAPPGSQTYTGMALDPTSGDVYASSCDITASSLFLVDVEAGTSTLIGAITNSPCTIGIAIDGNGDLYGYDLTTDMLLWIDKATGAGTEIGSIGFDANYGQGMGWDQDTDTLYMAAFNNGTFQPELRIVDRVSGNTALVGVLGATDPGSLCQLPFLAIPMTLGGEIPWLSEVPVSGTIAADGAVAVDIIFDASVVTQTGTYSGLLTLKTDDQFNKKTVIPVLMHVVAPAYGVEVSGPMEMTAGPGDVVTFTVMVTNTSNGPMDTFTLDVSGTYTATAPVEVGPLAAGESTMVEVVVNVPAGAVNGDSGTVVFTATSQGDDAVSASTSLTVNVVVVIVIFELYLPVVFKAPAP